MRSIGEMARDSGLSVSALRFYDGAGVLVPDWVDPVSGYRWYGQEQLGESRLLARLRRAGMPLADIRLLLAGWSSADSDLVRALLEAHLRRLEAGLTVARSEFSTVRELLDLRENPMTLPTTGPTTGPTSGPTTGTVCLGVSSTELAAALDAVRFAVSSDPELPMLGGVLFDIEGDSLHVVATDRYRMAVARAATTGHGGPRVQVTVPAALVDAMRALLTDDEASVQLTVDGDRLTLEVADRHASGLVSDHEFPDYRRLVRLPAGRRIVVDAPTVRKIVEEGAVRAGEVREQDGASFDLSVLRVAEDSTLSVCSGDDGDSDEASRVAVNRRFLLDALAAVARDELVFEFGAPHAPLAIRRTDSDDTYSLLMPVRQER